ncbi:MAG: putative metal-binding motif-containing protein, partial [archaeon]
MKKLNAILGFILLVAIFNVNAATQSCSMSVAFIIDGSVDACGDRAEVVNTLEGMGYSVTTITDAQIPTTNWNNYDLLVVGDGWYDNYAKIPLYTKPTLLFNFNHLRDWNITYFWAQSTGSTSRLRMTVTSTSHYITDGYNGDTLYTYASAGDCQSRQVQVRNFNNAGTPLGMKTLTTLYGYSTYVETATFERGTALKNGAVANERIVLFGATGAKYWSPESKLFFQKSVVWLTSFVDSDSDSVADVTDNCACTSNTNQQDSDNDGVGNVCDNCAYTFNADQQDTDEDGLGDVCDTCPFDTGNDADNDNYCAPQDCNDNNNAIYPTAQEKCNYINDDCDAGTDEDFPILGTTCSLGVGECARPGYYICSANGLGTVCSAVPGTPSAEICDNKDNDCDGLVDEALARSTNEQGLCSVNTETCAAGLWNQNHEYTSSTEICDNKDNDCDGLVDETLVRSTNEQGLCSVNTETCAAGLWNQNHEYTSSTEVCDNKDNDCDGLVDEDLTRSTEELGLCSVNTETCDAGSWYQNLEYLISSEICDNLDNDCDGLVDEGLTRSTNEIGLCSVNTETCIAGSWNQNHEYYSEEEICDAKDNDCDGLVDETFTNLNQVCSVGVGMCIRTGNFVCSSDKLSTVCSAVPGLPTTEICDNKDNDCDGLVDENLIRSTNEKGLCSVNTETCAAGLWNQNHEYTASAEVCDNKDNDCDSKTDEDLTRSTNELGLCSGNTETCMYGTYVSNQEYVPIPELCDAKDNDCDGSVDEGFNLGATCAVGVGECRSTGYNVCNALRTGVVCSATAKQPSAEICDNKDNDCDGQIDEGLKRSTNEFGQCSVNTESCNAGNWYTNNEYTSSSEICDNKDNDCDGLVDEDLTRPYGIDTGACELGSETCSSGIWVVTTVAVSPVQETCNYIDDDCDGAIDNGFNVGDTCLNYNTCQDSFEGIYICTENHLSTECSASITERMEWNQVCETAENSCGDTNFGLTDCDGICDASVPAERQDYGTVCYSDENSCGDTNSGVTDCNGLCLAQKPAERETYGETCTVGIGECLRTGYKICGPEGSVVCSVEEGNPTTEDCDNKDNDCDGFVDEALTRSSNELGLCDVNTETCSLGIWIPNGEYAPTSEICDNKDNNCDGQVDENLVEACGQDVCSGTKICSAGEWSECSTYTNDAGVCSVCDSNGNIIYDSIQVTDCSESDGWYNLTEEWVSNTGCSEIKKVNQVYRSYTCLGVGECTFESGETRQITSTVVRNKEDGTTCDDGLFCTVQDSCQSGICTGGAPMDCSYNDISGVNRCSDSGVRETYSGFTSTCNEEENFCTLSQIVLSTTCDYTCGAQCDATHTCEDTKCNAQCIDGKQRQCSDVANSCTEGCSCTQNQCSDASQCAMIGADNDQDGYDFQCGDCNDNDLNIHPGAYELCDGIDNNCDDRIDEGCPTYDSECVAISGPEHMIVNGTATMTVIMRNKGVNVWTNASYYKLGSQNPQDNNLWGLGRVEMSESVSVSTNQTYAFTFGITAPTSEGIYSSDWKMLQEWITWFGQTCQWNVNVTYDCKDLDQDGYNGYDELYCPTGEDCNDNNSNVHPGADDSVCNGIDNNCNGQIDEGYIPTETTCGTGVCSARGTTSCEAGSIVDSCTPGTSTTEICDGLDNDCNGYEDDGLQAPSDSCTEGIGTCLATGTHTKTCNGIEGWSDWGECSAEPGTSTTEICDGLDNDCNGYEDDGLQAPS